MGIRHRREHTSGGVLTPDVLCETMSMLQPFKDLAEAIRGGLDGVVGDTTHVRWGCAVADVCRGGLRGEIKRENHYMDIVAALSTKL